MQNWLQEMEQIENLATISRFQNTVLRYIADT